MSTTTQFATQPAKTHAGRHGWSSVSLAAHHSGREAESRDVAESEREYADDANSGLTFTIESLPELDALAVSQNATLLRLRREVTAARARARHVNKLPDPTIGANVFAHPIETAAGSQTANLTVAQMIPWLGRLDAHAQQACFEALALQQVFEMERLKVVGDARALWFRLYVLGKQIETNRANQQLLSPLIGAANARISTGAASQGDVLLGTLELSQLAEQLLRLEQQLASTKSELNRILGRDAEHPMEVPQELGVQLPDWSHEMLRQLAWKQQPAIEAARLRTQATRWGVEVARLKRRPDVSFHASWFAIDDNRPATNVVDVGRDAWAVGARVSVPIWHRKFSDIEQEAAWKHAASHTSVEDMTLRYDALLRDLWEQSRTANEIAKLYNSTLLPQARQTLDADIDSYTNGTVEFDRVMRNFRSVVTLELGYHRALGQLATALARIQQAVGTDLAIPAFSNF